MAREPVWVTPRALFVGLLLSLVGTACIGDSTSDLRNPFDPAQPPIPLVVSHQGHSLSISWDLRPYQGSPLLQGAELRVYGQVALTRCDPAGQVKAVCGSPRLVGTADPASRLTGPVRDAQLSVPWESREVTYELRLVESSHHEHLLAISDPPYTGMDDIDQDGVTTGDCDDGSSEVGQCDPHASCEQTSGVWACVCGTGYVGPGSSCEQDCSINNGGCDPEAVCTNASGEPHCACRAGFVGDGLSCTCPANQLLCDHACIDPSSDTLHCGGCEPCVLANGTPSCSDGSCHVKVCNESFVQQGETCACPEGLTDCSGHCVDTTSNTDHCGACDACETPHAIPECVQSSCQIEACESGRKDCNGQVGDGCEADINSDVNHCGDCGQACGGTCVAGRCRVELVSGLTRGTDPRLSIDHQTVYWESGDIHSVPVGGGTHVVLLHPSSSTDFGGFAVDAANVYWTDVGKGQVLRMPVGGGSSTVLASGQRSPFAVTVTESHVYWTNLGSTNNSTGVSNSDGQIMRVAITGGTPEVIVSGQQSPASLVVTSDTLFWLNYSDYSTSGTFYPGAVMKAPLAGGQAIELSGGRSSPASLALDSTNVYWIENSLKYNGSIMTVPIAGGSSVELATGQARPYSLVVDPSSGVYWTNVGECSPGVLGAILKMPLGGGPIVTLAPDEECPSALAIDGASVYWVGGYLKNAIVKVMPR